MEKKTKTSVYPMNKIIMFAFTPCKILFWCGCIFWTAFSYVDQINNAGQRDKKANKLNKLNKDD